MVRSYIGKSCFMAIAKKNFLEVICVNKLDWFIKDNKVWKKIDKNQLLNYIYSQLYDLQIGKSSESLKNDRLIQTLMKLVNIDSWPFRDEIIIKIPNE